MNGTNFTNHTNHHSTSAWKVHIPEILEIRCVCQLTGQIRDIHPIRDIRVKYLAPTHICAWHLLLVTYLL
jgi:hypothetical protein